MVLILASISSTCAAQSAGFMIGGQVTFPNGSPAQRVLVTLSTRAGLSRQTFTNDQGRFEFTDIPGGVFTVLATSPANPLQKSELVEKETPSRVMTDHVYVNLVLRDGDPGKQPKPGVITVEDADQRVPKEARKAFRQGLKFKDLNDLDKALQSFGQAIILYPDYLRALVERGDIYIAQRHLDQAAVDFDRALTINGHDGAALRGLGYCRLEKREFAEAVDLFEKSISAEPNKPNTLLLLGIANLELDRRESARQALQKALSFNGEPVPRAHVYLANLYAREHKYLQAAEELQKYIDTNPLSPEATELRQVETKWRALASAP